MHEEREIYRVSKQLPPSGMPAFVAAFVADRRKRLELATAEIERLGQEMDYWRSICLECQGWLEALARQYPHVKDVCAQSPQSIDFHTQSILQEEPHDQAK